MAYEGRVSGALDPDGAAAQGIKSRVTARIFAHRHAMPPTGFVAGRHGGARGADHRHGGPARRA